MNIISLTSSQLRRAALIKEKIAKLQGELNKLAGGEVATKSVKPARRKLSAAAIAKIRAGQKKRWAKIKAAKK